MEVTLKVEGKESPTPEPRDRLPSLVMVAKLEDAQIIVENDDGFQSEKLLEHARQILSGKRVVPSTGGAPVPVSDMILLDCNPEPIQFTLGVDVDFLFLVAVPSPKLGWALLLEVHKIWYSSSSPTGCLLAELKKLRVESLQVVEPPTVTGFFFPASARKHRDPSTWGLRPVRAWNVGDIYFTASVYRESDRHREVLEELKRRARIKKTVLFISVCLAIAFLAFALVCARGSC